ncbi:PIN domain nuclease [Rhodoferax sp.]|uniref:type II toxin-antitoxin system VapC family toxin n=1 Tax=Rhodoferax sp. TaxID=50421 RepID=UPI002603B672|nr:PIN domain nuclease [Rhodoferax sp.]MDD2809582.1 PIN domain nuclease [Rhodoferax sp.]MDD4942948.1 PIN domain nuclease [Rhodoferax sp.]
MILVDSSVWIDYFRGVENSHTLQLDQWLDTPVVEVGVADLVAFEVLRGFLNTRARQQAEDFLLDLPTVNIGGIANALQAAAHDRALRAKGFTIRSPIDVLLASYCITHGHMLLHRDADFDAIETLRGLKSWPH